MYGENITNLPPFLNLDPKNRIRIPATTGVEPSENIGFMFNVDFTKLTVYSYQELEQKLEEIEIKLRKLYDEGKIDYHTYHQYKRIFFAILCPQTTKVDKSLRITIPEDALKRLKNPSTLYVENDGKHLILCKNKPENITE